MGKGETGVGRNRPREVDRRKEQTERGREGERERSKRHRVPVSQTEHFMLLFMLLFVCVLVC